MKTLILVMCVALLGCEKPDESGAALNVSSGKTATEVLLKKQIESDGSAVFVSRGGRFLGIDFDAILSLTSNAHVELLECGIAPVTYSGSYRISAPGSVILDLPTYPYLWPEMTLSSTEQGVFLRRADDKTAFEMGGRGAATESSDMPPFWPFRMQFHSNRERLGSVAGLTETMISEGQRVIFAPPGSKSDLDASAPFIEFTSASELSFSPSGSSGPNFSGSYAVDDQGAISIQMKANEYLIPELVWFIDGDRTDFFLGTMSNLHEPEFGDESSSDFIRSLPWKLIRQDLRRGK